jgi:hypothetical protein
LPNLLLIRGLGHSGSTILDLALGSHPGISGLGEAARILDTPAEGEELRAPAQLRNASEGSLRFTRLCSCGVPAAECPVWGPLLAWLPSNEDQPIAAKMSRLLYHLEQHHSSRDAPLEWAVDSFQSDLTLLSEQPRPSQWSGCQVRVLFLVRDIRSWVHSTSRRSGRSRWRAIARWLRENQRIEAFLNRSELPILRLGYEELALAPEASLRLICQWLGVAFSPRMLAPGQHTSSHILSGNRMRHDPERSARIGYDGAWLATRSVPMALAQLAPGVSRLNQRLVYSNDLIS